VLGSRALQAFINAKDEEICRNDLDKAALVQTIQANAGLIQSLNAQMDIKEHTINAQKDLLACTNKKMDAMQAVIDALKKTNTKLEAMHDGMDELIKKGIDYDDKK
jgi:hypothetical protein